MKNPVPAMMTAVFVNPENGKLFTKKVDVPVLRKGDVLIKMLAAPVNPSDLSKIREITADEMVNFIPGVEGCGKVVAAGAGILPRIFMGKRVACSSKYMNSGTWAEYMVTPAGSCFPIGKSISDEQAAMTIVNPMTALAFLDYARKNHHKAVVNTAAAGALGKMVAALFAKHQIKVLNIVRNNEGVKAIGKQNNDVLNSTVPEFPEKFKEWCEKNNATLMFDAVGGELVNRVLPLLPARSTIVLYGNLSQEKIEFLPTQLLRENKKMVGFFLGQWVHENGLMKTVFNLIKAKSLRKNGLETPVQAVFDLENIQQAVDLYEKNMTKGKVLIKTRSK